MDTLFTIKSLSEVPFVEIKNIFNDAFADYILKMQVTEVSLYEKIKAENIKVDYSCGVFSGSNLIGFILIAIDEIDEIKYAYNAGTGVLPQYRGNQFTQRMYQYLIPRLEKDSIYYHQLEVLKQNVVAQKVYTQIGFSVNRNLLCFRGNVSTKHTLPELSIMPVIFYEALKIGIEFNKSPAWQNSLNTIERSIENHIALAAIISGNAVGCIVFSPQNGRVKLCFIKESARREGIGTALLYEAQRIAGKAEISIINVDDSDTISVAFLKAPGLYVYTEQYEMILQTNPYA
jgi:ribosomal protein S18 acetylase RimI-like enzyme